MDKLAMRSAKRAVAREDGDVMAPSSDDASGEVFQRRRTDPARQLSSVKRESAGSNAQIWGPGIECVESVVGQMRQSVLVVDDRLQLLWCNRAATRFLTTRAVLSVSEDGQLSTSDRREFARLRQWVADVILGTGDGHAETATSLRDGRTMRFCEIVACRGSAYRWLALPRNPIVAILFVSDPDQQMSVPSSVLRSLFALTERERQLAQALLNGYSLDRYAVETEIKVSTARTHLKSIFRKTDTNSQAALVSLLSRLVPPVELSAGDE